MDTSEYSGDHVIQKVVTLKWDGFKWRDALTGVTVTGVGPPSEIYMHGDQAPSQPNISLTIATVQAMIDQSIDDRILSASSDVSKSSGLLITYDWHRKDMIALRQEISDFRKKVVQSWWKRW
jgi:hypothetical protein